MKSVRSTLSASPGHSYKRVIFRFRSGREINGSLTLTGKKLKGGGYTEEAVANRCDVCRRFFRIGGSGRSHNSLYGLEQVTEKVNAD